MKSYDGLKEQKKHGLVDFPFEKYNISSDTVKQFATNHWHREMEIIYVYRGRIKLSVNGSVYWGDTGDIFIINSGELHEIYGITTPLEYCAFVFDIGMLCFETRDYVQKEYLEPIMDGRIRFLNKIGYDEVLFELLENMNNINTVKEGCYFLSTKANLLSFFGRVLTKQLVLNSKDTSRFGTKMEFLKKIVSYIDENYSRDISLGEISHEFGMSAKYFCLFFKKSFGKTFVEYVNDVRIENAALQLLDEDVTVTEVAVLCGFSNMSYFARTFKKRMECTPSEYKLHKVKCFGV